MSIKEKLKQTRQIILELLSGDERCRNDDKWLTYRVMRQFTNIYIPFEDFKKIPTFESISRCRRLVQNKDGLFPPTDEEVIIRRKVMSREIKSIMVGDADFEPESI